MVRVEVRVNRCPPSCTFWYAWADPHRRSLGNAPGHRRSGRSYRQGCAGGVRGHEDGGAPCGLIVCDVPLPICRKATPWAGRGGTGGYRLSHWIEVGRRIFLAEISGNLDRVPVQFAHLHCSGELDEFAQYPVLSTRTLGGPQEDSWPYRSAEVVPGGPPAVRILRTARS